MKPDKFARHASFAIELSAKLAPSVNAVLDFFPITKVCAAQTHYPAASPIANATSKPAAQVINLNQNITQTL